MFREQGYRLLTGSSCFIFIINILCTTFYCLLFPLSSSCITVDNLQVVDTCAEEDSNSSPDGNLVFQNNLLVGPVLLILREKFSPGAGFKPGSPAQLVRVPAH